MSHRTFPLVIPVFVLTLTPFLAAWMANFLVVNAASESETLSGYQDTAPDDFVFATALQTGVFRSNHPETECHVIVELFSLSYPPRNVDSQPETAGCSSAGQPLPGSSIKSISFGPNGVSEPVCSGFSYMTCIEPARQAATAYSDNIRIRVTHILDDEGGGQCCEGVGCTPGPTWPPMIQVHSYYSGAIENGVTGRAQTKAAVAVHVSGAPSGVNATWAAAAAQGYESSNAAGSIELFGIGFQFPFGTTAGGDTVPLSQMGEPNKGHKDAYFESVSIAWELHDWQLVRYPLGSLGTSASSSFSRFEDDLTEIALYFADENIAFEADIDALVDNHWYQQ